jgi:cellulase
MVDINVTDSYRNGQVNIPKYSIMTRNYLTTIFALLPLVASQQIGLPDLHPKLETWKCTTTHGCTKHQTSIVLDALSHPLHEIGNQSASCGDWSNGLNTDLCATQETCAENCILDGVNYAAHGVATKGDTLTLHQYMKVDGTFSSVSPRVYLLNEDGKNYDMLQLLNQEISFDVDVSTLVCGMNGALYLAEMLESGGRNKLNPAGAQYGTGYCDAQCPVLPWVNGLANVESSGACCNEMDLWEANAVATGYTPHACNITQVYECSGDLCGSGGVCDKSGCGYNPYALGDHDYYGYRGIVDTNKPFTVVTQFVTDDNTAKGALKEIRRLYVQKGKVIQNAVAEVSGSNVDSITEEYCSNSASYFEQMGGLKQMGKALGRGMVLIFSIWNDSGAFMNWLDSGNAGPCNSTEGNPELILAQHPETSVTFSNIRWGDIGSTFK